MVPSTIPQAYTINIGETQRDGSIRTALRAQLETESVATPAEEAVEAQEATLSEASMTGSMLLGDGMWSSTPQQGYVYQCQQGVVAPTGADPSWISGDRWFPEQKVSLSGSRYWRNEVTHTTVEGARVITANTLPDHATTETSLVPRTLTLQLPLQPRVVGTTCVSGGMVGIARNGVPIYQALDARGHDAVARRAADSCGGYVDSAGHYHYRSQSECLVAGVYEGAASTLVGYALDGFGIYASVENGKKVTNDDLDECHGHTHAIPWEGEMREMYHYHMTDEFPYTVGCFKGAPRTPYIEAYTTPEQDTAQATTTAATVLETNV